MKKQMLIAAIPLLALSACAESEEPAAVEEANPLEELAAGTGPYTVAYADGTMSLAYAGADGSEYTGTMPGPPATYTVTDGQLCVDVPEGPEGPETQPANTICLIMGEIGEDGSWSVSVEGEEGEPATMTRLDAPAASAEDQVAPGSYLVELPDEDAPVLVVWTEDGLSYLGEEVVSGTWRAEGTQRCTTYGDEPETCGEPTGEIGEDGSFTAQDGDDAITVTML